jgi:hypothetical protein
VNLSPASSEYMNGITTPAGPFSKDAMKSSDYWLKMDEQYAHIGGLSCLNTLGAMIKCNEKAIALAKGPKKNEAITKAEGRLVTIYSHLGATTLDKDEMEKATKYVMDKGALRDRLAYMLTMRGSNPPFKDTLIGEFRKLKQYSKDGGEYYCKMLCELLKGDVDSDALLEEIVGNADSPEYECVFFGIELARCMEESTEENAMDLIELSKMVLAPYPMDIVAKIKVLDMVTADRTVSSKVINAHVTDWMATLQRRLVDTEQSGWHALRNAGLLCLSRARDFLGVAPLVDDVVAKGEAKDSGLVKGEVKEEKVKELPKNREELLEVPKLTDVTQVESVQAPVDERKKAMKEKIDELVKLF